MINVSHLSRTYGPRTAVDDISFEVNRGEIVGFLGPNGAGKSTTMKVITGFMPATEGRVTVAGHDVFEEPLAVKRKVGYLPENPPVYFEMQVDEYLAFAARLQRVESAAVAGRVQLAIDKTGLGEVRKRLIGNLSKGFRQRVGLAQALVHNPDVLILDEPTVGLDPVQIIEIRELIKSLAGDHTVILSSHILPEVTATCKRVIVINRGKIVAEDTIDHLVSKNAYSMEVRTVTDAGKGAIAKIPGVQEVLTAGPHKLRVLTSGGAADLREQVLQTGVQSGMGVLEFTAERANLEDIFLKLITSN